MPWLIKIIMKKTLLTFLFLSVSICSFAQFTVSKTDGTPVASGQVISFNSIVYAQASLALKITNTNTSAINVRITCLSMTNTNGQLMEVCFGPDCYGATSVNQIFPTSGSVNIPVGSIDSSAHFFNNDTGISSASPVDYVFKIYQVNTFGTEIGTPFTFTYRFDATMAVNEIDQTSNIAVSLKSSVVDSVLELDVLKATNMEIFDLNGKQVLTNKLEYGIHTIDVSSLASGVYLVNFINEKGTNSSKKIIKK
jgi:hypothetical protein